MVSEKAYFKVSALKDFAKVHGFIVLKEHIQGQKFA